MVVLKPGGKRRLYAQSKTGDACFIVIQGSLKAYRKEWVEDQEDEQDMSDDGVESWGVFQREYQGGDTLGEGALTGQDNRSRRRRETVVATDQQVTYVAKLLRNDYVAVVNGIEKQVGACSS